MLAVVVAAASVSADAQNVTASVTLPDPEPIRELEFAAWATENGVHFDRLSCDVTPGEGDVCFVLSGPNVTGYIPSSGGWEEYGAQGAASTAGAPANDVTTTGTEEEFGMTFIALGGDEFDNATTYTGLASAAMDDFDLGSTALYSELAAESFGTLADIAIAAPGAGTPLGQAVVSAMQSCEAAWSSSAAAVDSFDVDAMDAAVVLLGDCNDQLALASELIG